MHVCTFVCVIFRYGSMNQYCSFWEKQLICCLLLSNALLHPTITPTHYNLVCVKLPIDYRYVWSHSLSHRTPTSLVMICRLTNGDPMTLLKLQSMSLSGSSPITRWKAVCWSQLGLSNKTGAGLPLYIAGEIGSAPGRKRNSSIDQYCTFFMLLYILFSCSNIHLFQITYQCTCATLAHSYTVILKTHNHTHIPGNTYHLARTPADCK